VLEELTPGRALRQTFTAGMDELTCLWLDGSVWNAAPGETVSLALTGADGTVLSALSVPAETFAGDGLTAVVLPEPVAGRRGERLTLEITAGGGLSFWAGTGVNTGRFTVETGEQGGLTLDGESRPGALVMRRQGINRLRAMAWFWPGAALLWALLMAMFLHAARNAAKGKPHFLLGWRDLWKRYGYLLRMLVARDFRVKYKASVLWVLWSFLNPLLMTGVYYFVFNTLFHSDIPCFTAYLMSGIIVFNYFSDATNLGLNAIVGNASLIAKVAMPRFIYPLSKVLSSGINLAVSLIPLLGVMLLSGVAIHRSILLLPFALVLLMVFCTGMALLLSAAMVFFRDTQFLWGLMLTVWNFLTPIFYPESIIPASLRTLYHCNPLYQLIFFLRSITIGGVSPTPVTFLYCLLAAFATLGVGWLVFRRTQDRFVLYL
jgi:ABC-2 type transport system permease protein